MARGSDKKKEEKKAAAEKKGSSKKGAIPKYAHFAKASLAPYPDEDGAPLWLGDKEGLQELLALSNIMASRPRTLRCWLTLAWPSAWRLQRCIMAAGTS